MYFRSNPSETPSDYLRPNSFETSHSAIFKSIFAEVQAACLLPLPLRLALSMIARLETYFEFGTLGTNWRTEVLAGFTTFITMAYIVVVNPAILHETGMPLAAVTAATCISAAIGSILMGVLARYPIALAPGMGLNAYFTYSVVKGMGVPWQTALGAVFISGVVFVLLTVTGLRQKILQEHSA
jgi:AGZA family xanthine/uracil permease-like MFS transporter